jgi:hypothetical protein
MSSRRIVSELPHSTPPTPLDDISGGTMRFWKKAICSDSGVAALSHCLIRIAKAIERSNVLAAEMVMQKEEDLKIGRDFLSISEKLDGERRDDGDSERPDHTGGRGF